MGEVGAKADFQRKVDSLGVKFRGDRAKFTEFDKGSGVRGINFIPNLYKVSLWVKLEKELKGGMPKF